MEALNDQPTPLWAHRGPSSPADRAERDDPPPSFRALYDDHFNFVWRTLHRLGVRKDDVTDLTQKVFLTAHLRLPDFEGRSPVEGWLLGICRRVASDYRRSAVIRREVSMDPTQIDLGTQEPDDSRGAAIRQSKAIIEIAMNKLSDPQRVVFWLFELGEVSGTDIAALLEIAPGTVRSRLRLARRRFRRELGRLLGGGSEGAPGGRHATIDESLTRRRTSRDLAHGLEREEALDLAASRQG